MKNAYQQDIRQGFHDANLQYVRVGAGQTGILNASDRQLTFKSTKREVRNARQQDLDVKDDTLRKHMERYFEAFKLEYPTVKLSAAWKQNHIEGIEMLLYAYGRVANKAMFKEGFRVTGQHKEPEADGITVDFDQTMGNCYSVISAPALENMRNQTSLLEPFIHLRGGLTWEEMDDANIVTSETSIDRGQLNHIRHWSEVISHEHVLENYQKEVFEKSAEGIAARKLHKEQEKELNKNIIAEERRVIAEVISAQKLLDSLEKKKANDALKKASSEEEKRRIAGLTPAEKIAEKAEKKRVAEEKRQAKSKLRSERRIAPVRLLLLLLFYNIYTYMFTISSLCMNVVLILFLYVSTNFMLPVHTY